MLNGRLVGKNDYQRHWKKWLTLETRNNDEQNFLEKNLTKQLKNFEWLINWKNLINRKNEKELDDI